MGTFTTEWSSTVTSSKVTAPPLDSMCVLPISTLWSMMGPEEEKKSKMHWLDLAMTFSPRSDSFVSSR